jgi:hypothetical protein
MNQKIVKAMACIGLASLFFLIGVAFIPLAGAQYDEVLFITTFISPFNTEFRAVVSGREIPVMLMSYLGTLKAFIMQPILDLAGYNHRTLRLPPLAFASVSVMLFFLALRRLTSLRIATLAGLLLVTDAAYLLTSVFDWGPVALQHLFFTTVLYSLVRYSQEGSRRWLMISGFAAGLALWDKAISIWLYAGGGIALAVVFWRECLGIVRKPRLASSFILPMILGASPLISYNIIQPFATARPVVSGDDQPLAIKVMNMDGSLNGGGLLGYLVRDVPEGQAGPLRIYQRASLWLSTRFGAPRRSFQQVVLVVSLLALPLMFWSPYRRPALCAGLAFLTAWVLMLLTKGAGGSLHHTILLWPLPHLLAGMILAEIARRMPGRGFWIGSGVFLFAASTNLAVLNQHYAQFAAYGPTSTWTNAARPLVETLGRMPGRIVFPVDWGIAQQVDFYGAGKLGMVRGAEGSALRLDDPETSRFVEHSLAQPEYVFVTHTKETEAFKGVRGKLFEAAARLGYREKLLNVIYDSHRVPIFEIHEFRK